MCDSLQLKGQSPLKLMMCQALKSPRALKSPPGGTRNILARARPEPGPSPNYVFQSPPLGHGPNSKARPKPDGLL